MAAIFQPLPGLPAGGGQYRQAFPDGVIQRPVKIAFPFVAADPIKSYTYATHPLLQPTVYGPSQTVVPPTGQPGSRPERYVRPFDKRDHPYPIVPMPGTTNSRGPPPFVARTVRSVEVGSNIVSAVAPQPTLPAVALPAPDPNFATRQPVGPRVTPPPTLLGRAAAATGRYLADSLAGAQSYFESQLPEDDEIDEDEVQQKHSLDANQAERARALARVQALQEAEENRAYRRLHGQLLSEHEKKEEREERRETNRLLRELNGNLRRRPAPEAEPEVFYEAQAEPDSDSEAESFDEDTYVPARRGRQRVYARTPGTQPRFKRPFVPGFRADGGQPRRPEPQPFEPVATTDPVINTLEAPVVPEAELRRQRIQEEIARRVQAEPSRPVSQDDFIRSYTAPAEPEPELAGPANRAAFNPFLTQPKREAPVLAGPSGLGPDIATTTETDQPVPPEPLPLGPWGPVKPSPAPPDSAYASNPTTPGRAGYMAQTEASRARASPRASFRAPPATIGRDNRRSVTPAPAPAQFTGPVPPLEMMTVADLKAEIKKLDPYASGLSGLRKGQLQDLLAKTRRQRGIRS